MGNPDPKTVSNATRVNESDNNNRTKKKAAAEAAQHINDVKETRVNNAEIKPSETAEAEATKRGEATQPSIDNTRGGISSSDQPEELERKAREQQAVDVDSKKSKSHKKSTKK